MRHKTDKEQTVHRVRKACRDNWEREKGTLKTFTKIQESDKSKQKRLRVPAHPAGRVNTALTEWEDYE